MTKTIDPQHAADLYALFDGDGVIEDSYQDDTNTAHGWVLLGSTPSRQSRWHEKYWMILRDADDALWGLEYGVGLVEDVQDDLPWDGRSRPLPLTRLYPHAVTAVEYRTKPAEVAA